ncbi:MAG: DUF5606 domain-containing protein [Bacteroidia bacterium]
MIDLRGIISISGHSGLFKVVSQTKFGLIVESIADGKRMPAYSSQRISALEDISVFTTGEDMPLAEVFQKIAEKENKGAIQFDAKSSNDELRKKLESYLPNFDKDRVYASDIKKLFSWYNLLQSKDLLNELKEDTKESVSSETENTDSLKEDKPKAKKTAKPKEEKQEKATKAKVEKKEAAPKKTPKKAAKEEGEEKPAAKAKKSTTKKADK